MTNQHGKDTVVLRAGLGEQTVGDLALKHYGRVDEGQAGVMERNQLEQNRRRDVVREIPRRPNPVAAVPTIRDQGSGISGGFEKIAVDNRDVGHRRGAKVCGEITVDFVRKHGFRARGQRARQGAAARSNLEKKIVRLWIDGMNNFVDPRALEKILTEALSRADHSASPRQYF